MKKYLFILSVILLICIIGYSSFKIYQKYQTKNIVEKISQIKDEDSTINELRVKYNNDEIIGILDIANMKIPILQGKDNEYYLNHMIDKTLDKTGSVFLDFRQNIDVDKQLNIFGHSSDYYELPFDSLLKYTDINFYKENKYATITSEKNIYKYEIFSIDKTDDEEHLKISFNNSDEYLSHLKKLKSNSIFDIDVDVNESDKILIIQTCITNDPGGSLLIINLRKVGEE